MKSAKELAGNLGTGSFFDTLLSRRGKKRRLFDYESQDDVIAIPEDQVWRDLFLVLVDTVLTSVKERF